MSMRPGRQGWGARSRTGGPARSGPPPPPAGGRSTGQFGQQAMEELQRVVERFRPHALVLAMRPVLTRIFGDGRDSVGWNPGVAYEEAVRGPGAHVGDDRDARPEFPPQRLDRREQLLVER